VAGGSQRRAGRPTAIGRISQHLKARLLCAQQPDPVGPSGAAAAVSAHSVTSPDSGSAARRPL